MLGSCQSIYVIKKIYSYLGFQYPSVRVQDWEDDPEHIFMKVVNPHDIHVQEQEPERLISTRAEESQVVINVQEDRTAQEIIVFKQGLIKLTPIFEDQHWVERTNAGSN